MNIWGLTKKICHLINNCLFHSACRVCQKILTDWNERVICCSCSKQIKMDKQNSCHICGRVLVPGLEICGDCKLRQPPFNRHVSFSIYEGVLKEIILLYKYVEIEILDKLLAHLLIQTFYERLAVSVDYIVPVPEDASRPREFNPMSKLVRIVGNQLNIPLLTKGLIKVKTTLPQAGLSQTSRLKNLSGAFRVNKKDRINHKKILLVDDVFTTGTTIKLCSRVLRRAGAEVWAMTIAKSSY